MLLLAFVFLFLFFFIFFFSLFFQLFFLFFYCSGCCCCSSHCSSSPSSPCCCSSSSCCSSSFFIIVFYFFVQVLCLSLALRPHGLLLFDADLLLLCHTMMTHYLLYLLAGILLIFSFKSIQLLLDVLTFTFL